jgi:alkyl hydroperoxide reductase subunit AhpF
MISTEKSGLSDETKNKLKAISKPAHIQVFVTLTCPYCSSAVAMGHRMAYESDNITADMVNAQEFPQLTQRYNVFAVPKVVINEATQFEGALPEDKFLEKVLKSTESITEE